MLKKITYLTIGITCGLFAWTYYQIIINTIKGWNLIHNGSLKQVYNFFNNEKWYQIGKQPNTNPFFNKGMLMLLILMLLMLVLESLPKQTNLYVPVYELTKVWEILLVAIFITSSIIWLNLPFDHVGDNHVSQLANQAIQKHYMTTKTVKSDHYSKIDDSTFIVNNKTYKVANKNNITNNYAKAPQKRSIKIAYQVVDKKLPKEVAAYRTIPLNKTQKNNDTIKIEIDQ